MKVESITAEVNIHLRARARDRDLIDQAAELVGANRSQFMLTSAVNAARNVLLDQTTLHVDSQAFQAVLEWMDAPRSAKELKGMGRLRDAHRRRAGG